MIRHIVGKHGSIAEFSDIDFSVLESVGLNEAAIIANTKYAMTGHGVVMPKLSGRRIIVTHPSFEDEDFRQYDGVVDYIKHAFPNHVLNLEPECMAAIEDAMLCAIHKVDRGYPNYWTILHLAIFHAVFLGYRRIFIYGCNHDIGCAAGYFEGQHYDYVEEHTRKVIEAANKLGIEIVRFKSRKEYDNYHEV